MSVREPFRPELRPVRFRIIGAKDTGKLAVPRRLVDKYEEIGIIETYDALGDRWSVLGRPGYVRLLGASEGEHHRRPVVFASKVLPYAVRGWQRDWLTSELPRRPRLIVKNQKRYQPTIFLDPTKVPVAEL